LYTGRSNFRRWRQVGVSPAHFLSSVLLRHPRRLKPALSVIRCRGRTFGPPVASVAASSGAASSASSGGVAVSAPANMQFNPNSPFSRQQQILLANISNWFNGFRLMEGEFIQFGPSGEQSEGVFFINRPGKIRFHFRPPARLDVISDGRSVAVKDGKTQTQDLYPLSKTPLRYLLAERIDMNSGIVSQVREEADLVSVVIVEKSSAVDGQITMIFDKRSYELRQWIVTDAQGLNTSVAVFNTRLGKAQDPNLFRITISHGP
jgi:outer membrane lipoprotein-sorting protein